METKNKLIKTFAWIFVFLIIGLVVGFLIHKVPAQIPVKDYVNQSCNVGCYYMGKILFNQSDMSNETMQKLSDNVELCFNQCSLNLDNITMRLADVYP